MTRVVVSGAAGQMGTLIGGAVEAAADLELVGRYDPAGGEFTDPGTLPEADVVVEFTNPAVVMENLELWHRLVREASPHRIEWRWTRGHADDAKNEYADWLAVKTAREGSGIEGLAPSGFEDWLAEQQEAGKLTDFFDVPDTGFHPDRPPPTV